MRIYTEPDFFIPIVEYGVEGSNESVPQNSVISKANQYGTGGVIKLLGIVFRRDWVAGAVYLYNKGV